MNPRVSRSSALASKATGYPIAKVAAKLAVGYTLDEIPNDLTRTTPASFEPTLDYVVVKFPRFAFEKFPGADTTLGTQMKSVGEAMGIGRTFQEAFGKAFASRELDAGAETPWHDARRPARRPPPVVPARAGGAPRERACRAASASTAASTRAPARSRRDSNYFYSTTGEADEARPDGEKPRVVILGSGPNRIGQGIEFDYCCVHAVQSFRAQGYEAVMVNCNPETVSTDYDTSDRLYFEPLDARIRAADPRARAAGRRRHAVRGPDAAQARARDRGGRLQGARHAGRGDRPRGGPRALRAAARRARHPLPAVGHGRGRATRRSRSPRGSATPCSCGRRYVLGGRSMRVCYDEPQVRAALAERTGPCSSTASSRARSRSTSTRSATASPSTSARSWSTSRRRASTRATRPACCPRRRSTTEAYAEVCRVVRRLGPALGVVGLLNVQLALVDGELSVLEVNPRASRTVPFASKATGVNLVDAAARLAGGARLHELGLPEERLPEQVSVKAAVLPFARFPGADPVLGPEMRSTGEVMASADDLADRLRQGGAGGRAAAADGPAPSSSRCARPTRRRSRRSRRRFAGLGFRPARDARHGGRPRGGRPRGRHAGEGRRRRRRDPRRPLRPRRQHAAGIGRAARRGADPRGGARRARAVHHDARGARLRRRRDRERAARSSRAPCRSGSSVRRELRRVTGAEDDRAVHAPARRAGRPRCRRCRASSSCSRRRVACCRGR